MRRILSSTVFIALLGCLYSAVQAAELLDVKPVAAGSGISVEITADAAMTYSYYKVPGQARAVVDIADADPEKVEPLIVVNKGAISSISVDKVEIAGMVVSRIVFNLVAESDITVAATADRKRLTVTFGGTAAARADTAAPQPAEPLMSQQQPLPDEQAAIPDQDTTAVPAVPAPAAAIEEDPLGLDEPTPQPAPSSAGSGAVKNDTVAAPVDTMPEVIRVPMLEPVVPEAARPAITYIRKVVQGDSYLEILADGAIADYKVIRLKKPERLAIDLPGTQSTLATKSIAINRFGISGMRIGVYPEHVRVVLDASKAAFPKHTIATTPNGIRITFK